MSVEVNWGEKLQRYTGEQISILAHFMAKLAATTRKTGKISDTAILKILTSFESFDVDVVMASVNTYIDMNIEAAKHGKGKNEKYVRGIMANKQAEKERRGSVGSGIKHSNQSKVNGATGADEGARLQQLAQTATGGNLNCEF